MTLLIRVAENNESRVRARVTRKDTDRIGTNL
jgi:hypothetical protein